MTAITDPTWFQIVSEDPTLAEKQIDALPARDRERILILREAYAQMRSHDRHRAQLEAKLSPSNRTRPDRTDRVVDMVVLGVDDDGDVTDAVFLVEGRTTPAWWRTLAGGRLCPMAVETREGALLMWLEGRATGGRVTGEAAHYAGRVLGFPGTI